MSCDSTAWSLAFTYAWNESCVSLEFSVNLELWSSNGLESTYGGTPYDLVREGKWTVDLVFEAAKTFGMEGNLVAGANIAGFIKVADAMLAQGVV